MRYLFAAMMLVPTTLCVTTASAQRGDPFAGPPKASDDPFGGPATADPFAPSPDRRQKILRAPANSATRESVKQKVKQALADGRKPLQIAAAKLNDPEQQINAALSDKTSVTFIETPLSEAVQQLSQVHLIPIVIDQRAIEEIGLSDDVPVSIQLKNVSLRSTLRLMLRNLDLTYLVKDEVLQITTVQAAENNLVLEMYALPENLAAKSDQVIEVMTGSVVPDAWEKVGGPSSAMPIGHVLVISTTSDVHAQIETFLAKLIAKYGK